MMSVAGGILRCQFELQTPKATLSIDGGFLSLVRHPMSSSVLLGFNDLQTVYFLSLCAFEK